MTAPSPPRRAAGPLQADISVIRAGEAGQTTPSPRSVPSAGGSAPGGDGQAGFELALSLTIEPGRTAAVLGPNGAGKSTVVETVAGLIGLSAGAVSLGSRTLDEPSRGIFVPPEDRRIGVVFQDYLLFEHLSVTDNVAFGLTATGTGRREAAAIARRWIERLELGGLEDRRPSALSGGQAQRVAIARALATEPDLLLLDEPLAALDVETRAELRRVLREHLSGFAGPRLIITHDPSDAFTMADSIHIIEHGRCTQQGTVDEIRRRPATAYVAALTGTNFLTGHNRGGSITLDSTNFELRTATTESGPVQAIIDPRAVSLYDSQPVGSPRNNWHTTIEWVEPLGETTRVQLAGPLPLLADVTPSAADAMGLAPGRAIWAAVKATEVKVFPR
jgi:molybdate transport system ATP-binding protein